MVFRQKIRYYTFDNFGALCYTDVNKKQVFQSFPHKKEAFLLLKEGSKMTDNFQLALSVGQNVALSVLVMFLLMSIGFFLAKKKIFTADGIKQLS